MSQASLVASHSPIGVTNVTTSAAANVERQECFLPMHTMEIDDNRPSVPAIELTADTISFDEFYRFQYPGLLAVATVLSGSEGEDLVHDAMVRALLHWTRISRLERPGGWAHRVLINRCRSWWRHKRVESDHLSCQRRGEPTAPEVSVETIAFWTAVRRLPTRPRLAMTLFYAADRTTAEVASILDVPEGTVRSDLSRARQTVARDLEM